MLDGLAVTVLYVRVVCALQVTCVGIGCLPSVFPTAICDLLQVQTVSTVKAEISSSFPESVDIVEICSCLKYESVVVCVISLLALEICGSVRVNIVLQTELISAIRKIFVREIRPYGYRLPLCRF